jgi:hypothetical protein
VRGVLVVHRRGPGLWDVGAGRSVGGRTVRLPLTVCAGLVTRRRQRRDCSVFTRRGERSQDRREGARECGTGQDAHGETAGQQPESPPCRAGPPPGVPAGHVHDRDASQWNQSHHAAGGRSWGASGAWMPYAPLGLPGLPIATHRAYESFARPAPCGCRPSASGRRCRAPRSGGADFDGRSRRRTRSCRGCPSRRRTAGTR